jgi:hypothetical protein
MGLHLMQLVLDVGKHLSDLAVHKRRQAWISCLNC